MDGHDDIKQAEPVDLTDSKAGMSESYNRASGIKERLGDLYDRAGLTVSQLASSAMRGGVTGSVLMLALTRGNLRVAFYGAVIGTAFAVGRRVYLGIKEDDPKGPAP